MGNTPPHWPRYGIGGLKDFFFPISNFHSPRRSNERTEIFLPGLMSFTVFLFFFFSLRAVK